MKKIFIIGLGCINFFNISFGQLLTKQKISKSESAIARDTVKYVSDTETSLTVETNKLQNLERNNLSPPDQTLNNSQIQCQENLKLAKSKGGKEYFNDGRLKLVVNINKIESYYRFCESKDTLLCWMDLINSWQIEYICDLYISYINFDANESSLIEVNQYLAEKYKEQKDTTRIIQHLNDNYITNVEFEEP